MTQAYVRQDIQDSIASIEFYHPAHNSLPGNILADLAHCIDEAGKNDAIKVIILKSAGVRSFCAGASFEELMQIQDAQVGLKFFSGFAQVINAMRNCPKFIIGRVQGKTVGGGVGLASATDYCMASRFGAIKLSELSIGLGPFVVAPAIERKIGVSAMSQLAIDAGNFYEAKWAQEKGLYAQVYETIEALDQAVLGCAENLSQYNPEAMREMKKIFWQGCEHWDDLLAERAGISGRLVLSEFTRQSLKRFG